MTYGDGVGTASDILAGRVAQQGADGAQRDAATRPRRR